MLLCTVWGIKFLGVLSLYFNSLPSYLSFLFGDGGLEEPGASRTVAHPLQLESFALSHHTSCLCNEPNKKMLKAGIGIHFSLNK